MLLGDGIPTELIQPQVGNNWSAHQQFTRSVVPSHYGILYSNENGQSLPACNMDESHKRALFHLHEILEQAKPVSAVRIQDDYPAGE